MNLRVLSPRYPWGSLCWSMFLPKWTLDNCDDSLLHVSEALINLCVRERSDFLGVLFLICGLRCSISCVSRPFPCNTWRWRSTSPPSCSLWCYCCLFLVALLPRNGVCWSHVMWWTAWHRYCLVHDNVEQVQSWSLLFSRGSFDCLHFSYFSLPVEFYCRSSSFFYALSSDWSSDTRLERERERERECTRNHKNQES